MELTDQRDIAAPPDAVWAALVDADVLRQCIPGCKEMSGNVDDGYECVAVQKVGPVKATFKAQITMSNVIHGQSCTITGEGKGGAAGFAKGAADVALTPQGEGTRLSYDVEAKVGGKLAQLGSRVIDGFAKKMADQFFDNFKSVVEGDGDDASVSVDPGGDAVSSTPPAPDPNAEPTSGGTAAPRPGTGDATAPPSSPDEPQIDKEKKGWFRKLMG